MVWVVTISFYILHSSHTIVLVILYVLTTLITIACIGAHKATLDQVTGLREIKRNNNDNSGNNKNKLWLKLYQAHI